MKQANPTKTNASRQLDSLSIGYETPTYLVDPDDLRATSVARKIGMAPEQVFKTLLTKVGGANSRDTHIFAVIPGDSELDVKKLARTAGVKKVELAALKEVEPLTGYVRGAVTVFAARNHFPVYVDQTIELFDRVAVSAGQRGLQLVLSPADYVRASHAMLADLTKSMQSAPEPGE